VFRAATRLQNGLFSKMLEISTKKFPRRIVSLALEYDQTEEFCGSLKRLVHSNGFSEKYTS